MKRSNEDKYEIVQILANMPEFMHNSVKPARPV